MDIFQLVKSYNKPWSIRETLAFMVCLTILAVILGYLVKQDKITLIQMFAGLVLFDFMAIVYASTVLTRISTVRIYELVPFWSWRQVILYHNKWLLLENLLNVALLFPMGLILPWTFKDKITWKTAWLAGFLFSATIEFSQLIFKRGWFEWDDMIHNSLGCLLGYLCMRVFLNIFENKFKENNY